MKQGYFHFDLNKCVGCHACMVACTIENGNRKNTNWRNISSYNPLGFPTIPLFNLSLACNHCESAPCLKNCPALAYNKDHDTGAIIHDAKKCFGCKYCTWACPYDAPKYNSNTKVIEKCDFCNHRVTENLKPACANLCPTGALNFVTGQTQKVNNEIPGFTEVGISPRIKIEYSKKKIDSSYKNKYLLFNGNRLHGNIESKLSIKKEWPLALFTLLSSILTALFTAHILGNLKLSPYVFISAGISGAFISSIHLGKKLRAWRSVLNLKNSWLSREIFFYALFITSSSFYLIYYQHMIIGVISIIFGVLCLFSIDKVYKIAIQPTKIEIHSAHVLLSYFLFTALFIQNNYALAFIGLIKATLYIYRKLELRKQKKNLRIILSAWRLDMLISFPFIFWFFSIPGLFWWLLISFLIGEIIDRGEYYEELDIITPEKQINEDFY